MTLESIRWQGRPVFGGGRQAGQVMLGSISTAVLGLDVRSSVQSVDGRL